MKKALSMILAFIMIMSLAACGSGSSTADTTAAPAADTEAAGETTASADASETPAAVSDDLPALEIKFGSVSATTHPDRKSVV